MRTVLAVMALIMLAPLSALTGGAPSFGGGEDEAVAVLEAPGFEATVDIVVPADYYVSNATMRVTGMAAEGNASAYPENVTVRLNETTIWRFQGTGYGPLGKQNRFSTGQINSRFSIESNGGSINAYIRLPKDAMVKSANVELKSISGINEHAIFTGCAAGDQFGISVSDAGDVNGDGYDDVMVGARWNDTGGGDAGQAYIYYGGTNMDNTADVVLTGAAAEDLFGNSVSSAGDVNNDGFDDVIVGAWWNDAGGWAAGQAYIYFGGKSMDSVADVILTGAGPGYYFGFSVSGAGDMNNDGYDDVIVGASSNDSGRAYIYYGAASMDNTAEVVLTGSATGDYFGRSVSDAGDVNKDGYEDVVVGADGAGKAYIFYGGANTDSTSDVIFSGESASDYFGKLVSGTGDVNNDGYDDVVVGAFQNDAVAKDSGRAYVYFGGSGMDNPISEALWTVFLSMSRGSPVNGLRSWP